MSGGAENFSRPAPAARILLGLIWVYQRSFSAIMGRQCRFYPTCSAYMSDALRRFGVLKGLRLGLSRLARCHPWSRPGYDPVPPLFPAKAFLAKSCSCDRTLKEEKGPAIERAEDQKEPSRA